MLTELTFMTPPTVGSQSHSKRPKYPFPNQSSNPNALRPAERTRASDFASAIILYFLALSYNRSQAYAALFRARHCTLPTIYFAGLSCPKTRSRSAADLSTNSPGMQCYRCVRSRKPLRRNTRCPLSAHWLPPEYYLQPLVV